MDFKYPFYSYASLHWAEHFACCEEIAPTELRTAARALPDFNLAKCRNWLNFYRAQAVTPVENMQADEDPIVVASQFNLAIMLNDMLGCCSPSQTIRNRSLYWAARLGHSQIVNILLRAGAEPDSRNLDRQTALTTAAEYGNLACVTELLADERTDPNTPGRRGRSALSFSCANGNDDIVDRLLSRRDCNVDEPDDTGATPFFWAVGGGSKSLISALTRHRQVDINHRDKNGRTAISWAAGDGMADVLAHLLDLKGIDVNLKAEKSRWPLSWRNIMG